MKKKLRKGFVALLIAAMILMTFMPNIVCASGGLILEKNHEWVTGNYSHVNGVAAGDIDGDNITEIITVGYFYNSTSGFNEGEVDIWNWNGTNLTLEHTEYYGPAYTISDDTRFYDVALGNVDNDTDVEIVIAGYGNVFGVQEQGLLLVGSWNGSAFSGETLMYWPHDVDVETKAFGVAIDDVDDDNTTEIITVGYENATVFGVGFHGQVAIWNITGGNLVLETSYEWLVSGDTFWRSVSIEDVDLDGELEFLIVGDFYDNYLGYECAMLRIGTWNGSALEWDASHQWYTYFDTYAFGIATGDLDSDGIPEIVTIGRQRNSETVNAQFRIWSWEDDVLTLKTSVEGGIVGFFASTAGKTVTINDVDNDGINEIIVGVDLSMFFWGQPNVRVLSWDGETLAVEDSKDWDEATNVQDVVACDVDDDGAIEIITVGYSWQFMLTSKSELGIWSVSQVASSITVTLSSPSIVISDQATISGQVTNETDETPIPHVEVTLESSYKHGDFTPLATVMTDEQGGYTFTWTPPATGYYTIKASWKGDFEHEGASDTTTLTVEKASSLIVLTLSGYTAEVGANISVNGILYPAKATTITIEYALPNGTISIETVSSNSEGIFSKVFTADQVGEWPIKASWAGDNVYAETESSPTTLTVAKIPSSLSITASPLTVNIGEEVTISGTLTPAQTATITLTYTMSNGTTTTKAVATTSAGVFTHTIELNQGGIWQVKASWNGNEQYEATASVPITVTAQTVDQTTQILAMAGLGLGLIALVIAIAGIFMASKKKTGALPPTTTEASPPQPPSPPPPTSAT